MNKNLTMRRCTIAVAMLIATLTFTATMTAKPDTSPRQFLGAQLPAPGDHRMTVRSSVDCTTQPYRLFVPSAASKNTTLPLLVVLHGMGVDENAWFDFTPVKKIAEERGWLVAAPLGRGNWFYRSSAEQDVLDIVEVIRGTGRVPDDRVYLTGHSMGGWGTWWLGIRNPDVFTSIAPLSGFPPRGFIAAARNSAPFIAHSDDDEIVPVEYSDEPAAELKALGAKYKYLRLTGYGHDSRMIGDLLPEILTWFEQHPRNPSPKTITIAARTRLRAKHAWLQISNMKPGPIRSVTIEPNEKDAKEPVIRWPTGVEISFYIPSMVRAYPGCKTIKYALGNTLVTGPANSELPYWSSMALDGGAGASQQLSINEPPSYKSGRLAHADAALEGKTSDDALLKRIGSDLAAEAKADYAVFPSNSFKHPGTPLTVDSLLDLYVMPHEKAVVRTARNVQSLATKRVLENLRLISSKGIETTQTLASKPARATVIIPEKVAERLPDEFEPVASDALTTDIPVFLLNRYGGKFEVGEKP